MINFEDEWLNTYGVVKPVSAIPVKPIIYVGE